MNQQDIFNAVIDREGGYVDHPNDSGGPTKWGVTQAVARAHGYSGDMRNFSREQALIIFNFDYWVKPRFNKVNEISSIIAVELCDTGINMGPAICVKWLQRWLSVFNKEKTLYSDLKIDGVIGNKTLIALQRFLALRGIEGEMVLLKALNCSQGQHYLELAEQRYANESFIYGWLRERVTVQ